MCAIIIGSMYLCVFIDKSIKCHHIGVLELCHDGSFLEELDSVHLSGIRFECLYCNIHRRF